MTSLEKTHHRQPATPAIDLASVFFLTAVAAFHIYLYFTYPNTPFHHPSQGWEGWWDQSQYLKSARAFAAFDFSSDKHWYPIGYSLLGAPFALLVNDPFFLPNLLCVVVFAWSFQRYFRPVIGISGVVVAFFGALAFPLILNIPFEVRHLTWLQFVIPWNTVPVAALYMLLLCLTRELHSTDGLARDWQVGALTGAIAVIRPVDVLPLLVPCAIYLLGRVQQRERMFVRTAFAVFGGVCVILPILALSVYIHGSLLSPYNKTVAEVGMSAFDLPQRALDIFVDAAGSFGEPNTALFGVFPWLPLAILLALIGSVLQPRVLFAPVFLAVATFLTYLCFNDFSPANVLRYFLIHYLVWTFPVLLAAGISAVVLMPRKPRSVAICLLAVFAAYLLASMRVEPERLVAKFEMRKEGNERSYDWKFPSASHLDALDIPSSVSMPKDLTWGNPLGLLADSKGLVTFKDYQIFKLPDRWRVIFKRPFEVSSLSLRFPGLLADEDADISPLRFSLGLATSPWAEHRSYDAADISVAKIVSASYRIIPAHDDVVGKLQNFPAGRRIGEVQVRLDRPAMLKSVSVIAGADLGQWTTRPVDRLWGVGILAGGSGENRIVNDGSRAANLDLAVNDKFRLWIPDNGALETCAGLVVEVEYVKGGRSIMSAQCDL